MQAAAMRSWFIIETSPAPTSSPPAADSCRPSLASHLALVGLSWGCPMLQATLEEIKELF